MLRFIQMFFIGAVAGLSDFPGEALASERWRANGLERSLGEFAASWDRLNQRFLAGHPMLDSRLVDALLRHFGDGSEHLYRLERNGETTGMCILKRAKPGLWTSFLPAQAQLAPVILEHSRDLSGLLPVVPGLVGQVDLLCQDPHFSPVFHCHELPSRKTRHALTMSVRIGDSFDTYWAERPKSLRANMRTRENRLAKAGLQPRLVLFTDPGAMRDAVARFAELETSGWKGRAGTALGSDGLQVPFYGEIMEKFAQTGQAFIYEYWLDDRLAASQLAISADRMFVLLKTTYNEEFAYYSPGRLLLREVLRDGFARFPGGVIEFYTNADADQLAWATDQRWIEHVSIYRNHAVEQVITTLQAMRRRVQEMLHRTTSRAEESA